MELLLARLEQADQDRRSLIEEVRALRAEVDTLRQSTQAILTLPEAAKYLKVSRATLKRYVDLRKIRPAKLHSGQGGAVRFRRAELDRFVEHQERF